MCGNDTNPSIGQSNARQSTLINRSCPAEYGIIQVVSSSNAHEGPLPNVERSTRSKCCHKRSTRPKPVAIKRAQAGAGDTSSAKEEKTGH